MSYIDRKIDQLLDWHFRDGLHSGEKLMSKVQDELMEMNREKDKLKLLTAILEANDEAYTEHLKTCTNLNSCNTNLQHEKITYFLGQELDDLGIVMDEDVFTREEKAAANSQLEEILKGIKDLKDGQQVMYDDLYTEIQELKQWYILGKKNWKALFVGKISEMVTAGVISEAVSKPLLEGIKQLPTLLGAG